MLRNALPDNVKDARNVQNFKYEPKHKEITELKTTTFIKGTTVTRDKDLKSTYIMNNFEHNYVTLH